MFFRFMRTIARIVFFIANGNAHYEGKERLPKDGNYVLVGPHRTWWDPLYFAIGARPKNFCFMAKEELFRNPILRFILVHSNAFPVNRDNPGPSVIKRPVKLLKSTKLSLIMFPSGSRHSDELKGGAALISKMAKVPIVPAVYQGPLTLKDLFKRKRIVVRFGDPIHTQDIVKMDKAGMAEVEARMNAAFKAIDAEIDPNYHYIPTPKKSK